jgi:hypothetical protein
MAGDQNNQSHAGDLVTIEGQSKEGSYKYA